MTLGPQSRSDGSAHRSSRLKNARRPMASVLHLSWPAVRDAGSVLGRARGPRSADSRGEEQLPLSGAFVRPRRGMQFEQRAHRRVRVAPPPDPLRPRHVRPPRERPSETAREPPGECPPPGRGNGCTPSPPTPGPVGRLTSRRGRRRRRRGVAGPPGRDDRGCTSERGPRAASVHLPHVLVDLERRSPQPPVHGFAYVQINIAAVATNSNRQRETQRADNVRLGNPVRRRDSVPVGYCRSQPTGPNRPLSG